MAKSADSQCPVLSSAKWETNIYPGRVQWNMSVVSYQMCPYSIIFRNYLKWTQGEGQGRVNFLLASLFHFFAVCYTGHTHLCLIPPVIEIFCIQFAYEDTWATLWSAVLKILPAGKWSFLCVISSTSYSIKVTWSLYPPDLSMKKKTMNDSTSGSSSERQDTACWPVSHNTGPSVGQPQNPDDRTP